MVGFDHDDTAVASATHNFSSYPNIKIFKADALSIPLEDESFDFVICMTTFANFGSQKLAILAEMKRVLKDQ